MTRQDKPWPGSEHLRFQSCVCHWVALAGLPVLTSNGQAVLEEPVGLIPGEYKLGKSLFTIFSVLI